MNEKNNLFLAPMAGISDASFRKLCQEQGAGLTFTEMISVNALARKNKATLKLLQFFPDENVGVQLFGYDPKIFIKAISVLKEFEKENNFKFKVIDLNFGCPASKIIKQGSGSALLERPNKIKQIVEEVVKVAERPVYCKIRTGIDSKKINAVEIAKICQNVGADLITVHGRTQKQGYTGKADWSIIKEVKNSVEIPVCANGDIKDYDSYLNCKKETNADFFMIGRASLGNSFVFKEIIDEKPLNVSKRMKLDVLIDYIDLAKKVDINFNQIKTHAQSFIKGIPNSAFIRNKISKIKGMNGLLKLIKELELMN
jgi:tRNA-dihydrouridine synthase B